MNFFQAALSTFSLFLVAGEVGRVAATSPEEQRQQQLTRAAHCANGECIFHVPEALPEAAAPAAAKSAQQQPAIAISPSPFALDTANTFRELTHSAIPKDVVVRHPLHHIYEDCWEPCGARPGFCPKFCGTGNACCRRLGDHVVPDECKAPISPYRTWHYECVQPKPDMSLGSSGIEDAVESAQTAKLSGPTIVMIASFAGGFVLFGLAAQYILALHQVAQERNEAKRSFSHVELANSSSADLELAEPSDANDASATASFFGGLLQTAQPGCAHVPAFAPTLLQSASDDAARGK